MTAYAPISPRDVVARIAEAIPAAARDRVILIGSLAAGFHFFGDDADPIVRTKDVDCLLAPRVRAMGAARDIAESLLAAGWTYHPVKAFLAPGSSVTPSRDLPVVRLDPPGGSTWFLELLAAHADDDRNVKTNERLDTTFGYFALPSFRYLALAERQPLPTPFGLRIARPEAMALANLLAHPAIEPELMSDPILGRRIKRSNKDLGRVIAIATLSGEEMIATWPEIWWSDLRACFGSEAAELASRAGNGLRELLASTSDLDEARHTCEWGLLASHPPTSEQLRARGLRLIQDAIEPLELLARGSLANGGAS